MPHDSDHSDRRDDKSKKTKLYVGNVPPECKTGELRSIFEKYGKVTECDIVKHYAFVHYDKESDAVDAVTALNNTVFQNSILKVQHSLTTAEKGGPPRTRSNECFQCGQPGHWAKLCPLNDNRERSRPGRSDPYARSSRYSPDRYRRREHYDPYDAYYRLLPPPPDYYLRHSYYEELLRHRDPYRRDPYYRGYSPSRRAYSPSRRGRSPPPRRGLSPPRRGLSPPRRGLSPPRRGLSPPRRGLSPPPLRHDYYDSRDILSREVLARDILSRDLLSRGRDPLRDSLESLARDPRVRDLLSRDSIRRDERDTAARDSSLLAIESRDSRDTRDTRGRSRSPRILEPLVRNTGETASSSLDRGDATSASYFQSDRYEYSS